MKRILLSGLLAAATVVAPRDAHPDVAAAAVVRGLDAAVVVRGLDAAVVVRGLDAAVVVRGLDARRDAVVARLGAPPGRSITVGELEDRIAALPPFQRASYGGTADLVRRNVLAQILVPEALLAAGAADGKIADEPRTARELDRVLSTATIRAVRGRIGPAAAIALDDVRKYYDDNRPRYDAPERYQLWRILCATRDEATLVLEQAKGDPTPKTFGELAREHSLDKASSLREGNLGFLTLDGASSEPGLRVDPAIVRAARGVRDGELVPAPVPEGEYFSVVWRRGTIAANRRTVDDVAAQIRDALWKARVKEETDRLLDALRASKLRDYDPSLVETIALPVDTDAGGTVLHRHAGPP